MMGLEENASRREGWWRSAEWKMTLFAAVRISSFSLVSRNLRASKRLQENKKELDEEIRELQSLPVDKNALKDVTATTASDVNEVRLFSLAHDEQNAEIRMWHLCDFYLCFFGALCGAPRGGKTSIGRLHDGAQHHFCWHQYDAIRAALRLTTPSYSQLATPSRKWAGIIQSLFFC